MADDPELILDADASKVRAAIEKDVTAPLDQAAIVAEMFGKKTEESFNQVEKSAKDAGEQVGGGSGGAGGLVSKLSNLAGTGMAVVAAFTTAYSMTRQLIEGLKDLGIDVDKSTRGWADWVAGVDDADKALGQFATALDETNRVLEKSKQIRTAYTDALQKERDALEATSLAIVNQVNDEMQRGELQEKTVQWIQKTLDRYEALGDQIPASLENVVTAFGILSTSQQKAAEDAEKTAEREEKAAARKAKAAEEAAARKIKAIESELAAAEKQQLAAQAAYDAEVERNQKAGGSSAEAEIANLESKERLTIEELNRLNELRDSTGSLTETEKKREAQIAALAREDEAYTKVQEARARVEEAEYQRREQALTAYYAQQDAIRNATEDTEANTEVVSKNALVWQSTSDEMMNVRKELTNTGGEVEKLSVEWGNTSDEMMNVQAQLTNTNEALGETAAAAPAAAGELNKLGEASKTAEQGMTSMADASERSLKALEGIAAILPEIIKLAAEVQLGGPADAG